jgi:hypothetical protein
MEERAQLLALVRSPGWHLVMTHLILPEMDAATAQMDRPQGTTHDQTNILRGVKHAFRSLLDPLYRVAGLPNPFEQHRRALLTALASYAGLEQEDQGEEYKQVPPTPQEPGARRPRSSAPV